MCDVAGESCHGKGDQNNKRLCSGKVFLVEFERRVAKLW